MSKWLVNLCEAERQGTIKFVALLSKIDYHIDDLLIKNGGRVPYWILAELKRMQRQEASHYSLMRKVLTSRGIAEVRGGSKKESVADMLLSEKRWGSFRYEIRSVGN